MRIAKARPFEGKPIINMPSVYGGCIGKEIICRVPVIGTRPIRVEVQGLRLDGQVIRGTVPEGGEFRVRIAAENGLGRAEQDVTFRIGEDTMLLTPLMGFTSWNAFGANVSQEKMEDTAAAMAALGIADYGYCYVNIDSGWQKEYGGEFDAVMPNEKFPDMKGFCRKMHEAGFKCGIYSTPMLTAWGCPKELPSIPGCTRGEPNILFTCNNGGVGRERLEENNVRQWADWGFDYLKYDWAPTEPINADYMKKSPAEGGPGDGLLRHRGCRHQLSGVLEAVLLLLAVQLRLHRPVGEHQGGVPAPGVLPDRVLEGLGDAGAFL